MSTPTQIIDGTGTRNKAEVTPDNALKVTIADQPVEVTGVGTAGIPDNGIITVQGSNNNNAVPLSVYQSPGTLKKFAILQLVNSAQPAIVDNSSAGPYTVGGTTFSITVNSILETYTFPSRGATPGESISGLFPATSIGTNTTLNVSIDGGGAKNINITPNLSSGAAIAASIQIAIRANIPGGSTVTCDYNVTNPGQYTIISGTTGTSSKVTIKSGGGTDVTAALKLGVANGGTEFTGTIANSYRQAEIISAFNNNFSDFTTFISPAGFTRLQTIAAGSTATIQVSATGANTALGFPTTLSSGTNGTGLSSMNVNGSTTNQIFTVPALDNTFLCNKITFNIRSSAPTVKLFGSLNQLTNGVLFQITQAGANYSAQLTFRTGGEMIQFADSGSVVQGTFSDNTGLTTANFIFNPPLYFSANGTDGPYVTIRDDLSTLTAFNVYAYGIIG